MVVASGTAAYPKRRSVCARIVAAITEDSVNRSREQTCPSKPGFRAVVTLLILCAIAARAITRGHRDADATDNEAEKID